MKRFKKGNILLYNLENDNLQKLQKYFLRKGYNVFVAFLIEDINKIVKNCALTYTFSNSNFKNKEIGDRLHEFDPQMINIYLDKPVQTRNLLKNIKSLNNQTNIEQPILYKLNSYTFNVKEKLLNFYPKDNSTPLMQGLTKKESAIIEILCQNLEKIVPKHRILMNIWHREDVQASRSLDVYISRIRKYFALDKTIQLETKHSIGFCLKIL